MPPKFNRQRWIINQLRRISLRYPPAIKATNRYKEEYYITSKKGKPMKRVKFTCPSCWKKDFKRTQMNLDHIKPVVASEGFTTWDAFIDGLLCDEDNLWLICIPCHETKTALENNNRTGEFNNHFKKSTKK